MAKLFLKNIKVGTKVKIKESAAVVDFYSDIMMYWPKKYKNDEFIVLSNNDFTSYVIYNTKVIDNGYSYNIKKTNKFNLEIVNK